MDLPAFTDLTGLAGIALALGAGAIALPGVRRLSPRWRIAIFAAVWLVVLAPIAALPLAELVRGATGDLSITTVMLLACALLRRLTGKALVRERARFAVLVFVSIAAVALYPMALGVGLFDPYRLGYGSPWLVGGLFAVALAAWLKRVEMLALFLALALLAWTLRWYESTNLWDYLLDPLVSCYALGSLAVRGVQRARRRFLGHGPIETVSAG